MNGIGIALELLRELAEICEDAYTKGHTSQEISEALRVHYEKAAAAVRSLDRVLADNDAEADAILKDAKADGDPTKP